MDVGQSTRINIIGKQWRRMARKIVSRGFYAIQKTQGLEDGRAHGTPASGQPSDRIDHLDGDAEGYRRVAVEDLRLKSGILGASGDVDDGLQKLGASALSVRGVSGDEDRGLLEKPAVGPSAENSPDGQTSADETANAGDVPDRHALREDGPEDGTAGTGAATGGKDGSPTAGKSGKSPSLSTIKIIASAAAAITASVITTKLAGYMNSFLIVGCSSMIIAVLSEVYSRTLKKVRRVSARVVYGLPYEKVLPAAAVSSIDRSLEHAMEDTTTMAAVSSAKDAAGGSPRADEPAVTSVPADASPERAVEGQQDGEHDDGVTPLRELQSKKGAARGLLAWAVEEVRSFSWLTKAMIMIFGAALLSTGVNWMMVQAMEQPNITNVTQQITKEEVQQLPESEKQAIKQAAIDAAQQNADALGKKIDSISSSLTELTDRVSKLEEGKKADDGQDAAQPESGDTADASTASKAELDSLKTQIAELQSELASLKAGSGGSPGSSSGGNSPSTGGGQSTPPSTSEGA